MRATDGPVIVVDNGACKCRMGIAGESKPRTVFENAAAKAKGDSKLLVGSEIDNAQIVTQLNVRRPLDRGYLVNWDLEQGIWSKMMDQTLAEVKPHSASLLMTEPLFNLAAIQRSTQEVVFEHFQFRAMHSVPAPELAIHQWAAENPSDPMAQSLSGVVIDAGYSFTHAVPIFDGQVQLDAVKRIQLGGKVLSNLLKEWVSYRSMNLNDEPYLVELIKDQVSFVSLDVKADMQRCYPRNRSALSVEFVLPDGVHNTRGFVRDPRDPAVVEHKRLLKEAGNNAEQLLLVNSERFMVPEALFNPSDIGIEQAGVCETAALAVRACHPVLRPLLTRNVLLMGGTAQCPGFGARVGRDLRPFIDADSDLAVNEFAEPQLAAWRGGSLLGSSGHYADVAVTKAEYDEHGAGRTPFG